jgi:DnaJ-domain-containing protein 1
MSNVFDRVSKVAKAEWNALRKKRADADLQAEAEREVEEAVHGAPMTTSSARARPITSKAVPDVEAALRVLELPRTATLDEVRARYRELARRYQPRTQSQRPDDVEAAHTLMLALTDALELLEEHLLPLP